MDKAIETLIIELNAEKEPGAVRRLLNRFAAEIVQAVMPDDPACQHAVARKAVELGVHIARARASKVVRLADYMRPRFNQRGDAYSLEQRAALMEIGEMLQDLVGEARAAKLDGLAEKIEEVAVTCV